MTTVAAAPRLQRPPREVGGPHDPPLLFSLGATAAAAPFLPR